MNIVLIGYRGSGKTHIGRKLANLLWMEFVDTDMLLVERAGRTIREIFEAEGEAGFRQREADIVSEVARRENVVIAAGGGAILRPDNVAALRKHGKIVWLKADPETLHARIQADAASNANRPNLTAGGGLEEVRRLLDQRTPLYAAAAAGGGVTLDVTHLSIDDAAKRLVTLL
jgi:shikimate kinase